jgi:hypothetical protein
LGVTFGKSAEELWAKPAAISLTEAISRLIFTVAGHIVCCRCQLLLSVESLGEARDEPQTQVS